MTREKLLELCDYLECNDASLEAQCEAAAFIRKALAQPEQEEKLPPVEIGVDVTKEGTAVTAFYRRPNAVMEMFYSQFHPLAQPEQEPDYAWPTIEDYENDVGFTVGDAFKIGWSMARTTNDLFTQMVKQS